MSEEDAEGEQEDDAEFDEGAEVIARGEQQPDGQDAGGEAVDDDGESESDASQVNTRTRWATRRQLSADRCWP